MSSLIPSEIAEVLKRYQERGWQFTYGESQNPAYPHTVVLHFTVPGQVPRFERFRANDPHLVKTISRTLSELHVVARATSRYVAEASPQS